MSLIESLFGPPNVEKLAADRDLRGLAKAVSNKRSDVRLKAIAALRQIGGSDVVPLLLSSLRDQVSENQCAAASALGAIGDQRAVTPLTALVAEEERYAARSAEEDLGSFIVVGTGSKAVSGYMEGFLRERGVRQAALEALRRLEEAGRR